MAGEYVVPPGEWANSDRVDEIRRRLAEKRTRGPVVYVDGEGYVSKAEVEARALANPDEQPPSEQLGTEEAIGAIALF